MAEQPANKPPLYVGATAEPEKGTVTVRQAGSLKDLAMNVSPNQVPLAKALQHMAKAINIALTSDYLETELDQVFKTARVRKGAVEVVHNDYFGLGDGIIASVGKFGRSIQLTLRGPDPGSPEGKKMREQNKGGPIGGLFNFLGRKLDLVQEFEDMVPTLVEQMLDRLEAGNVISGWNREEWEISTKTVGLDVVLRPVAVEEKKSV